MRLEVPEAEEYGFIFDSWAASFKKSPYAGCITNDMYPDVSRRTMQDILDRGARVMVAVTDTTDGERRVMGYSVSEPDKRVLHYIYVKRDFRGMGIGKRLLDDVELASAALNVKLAGGGGEYTHRTKASEGFLGRGWHWNPVPARVKAA